MKKIILPLFLGLFVSATLLTSCNVKKSTSDVSGDTSAITADSLRIIINPEAVDSILFIPNEGQPFRMDMADCKLLSDYLSRAVYNTRLNQSGIMMKMQAPDYTITLYYKDKSEDESDWLMIWKEDGRAKFANKWYDLAESNRNNLYSLLEKYNKPIK
jgi:hypothetical protein